MKRRRVSVYKNAKVWIDGVEISPLALDIRTINQPPPPQPRLPSGRWASRMTFETSCSIPLEVFQRRAANDR